MSDLPRPKRVLISKDEIRSCIRDMAGTIKQQKEGLHLTFVPVLNGAWRVMSRLMSHLDGIPMQFEPVMIRSYQGMKSGEAKIDLLKLDEGLVRKKHVVIVDDILDSGQTLTILRNRLMKWEPASLMIAVMLDKKEGRKPEFQIEADCIGKQIENQFVVGMGLDYRGYYRNLSYIGVLSEAYRIAIDKIVDDQKLA